MRAIIKGHFIGDDEDLSTYESDEPQLIGFTLAFAIGPADSEGQDFFEVFVASAAYPAKRYSGQTLTFIRHVILTSDCNVQEVVAHMSKYISTLEAGSWESLATKIGRMAWWEYGDYRP